MNIFKITLHNLQVFEKNALFVYKFYGQHPVNAE